MSQAKRACAWISLDEPDSDFFRFLEYVTEAVRSIDPTLCGETRSLLQSSQPPPADQLVYTFINEVASATREFVLIFDDYQAITSFQVHSALSRIIQDMPANMGVVIITRQYPSLPTLRMDARGELQTLGVHELSFTEEETVEFLIERKGHQLNPADIRDIHRWSEGWPVALRLLSSAIQGRSQQDTRGLLASLGDNIPSVGSYLWDEVIRAQPATRRQFLLETSLLNQVNPDLASAITGLDDSADLLAGLERDNLFISRLNGPGNWYRYHHLFADVLYQRLESEGGAERTRELHELAARWLEERQLVAEAARHAVKAQSWELASRLLVQICKDSYENERIGNLREWLSNLPDEPLKLEPRLACWLAWAQIAFWLWARSRTRNKACNRSD